MSSLFDINFKIITVLIYIHLLWYITCQYTTIWYDDMENDNGIGWSVQTTYASFNFPSGGCASGTCCVTNGGKGTHEWVIRSTDISSYSYIRLQLHISTYKLYPGSTCKVFYSYTSIASDDKLLIKTIDPPDDGEDRHFYADTVIDLPYSPSANTVWIWLYSDSPSDTQVDWCVWDDVYLKGIPNIEATPTPTSSPINLQSPSKSPIQSPTESPNKLPTKSPIKSPTQSPSAKPTTPPLLSCGQHLSGDYNDIALSFDVQIPYHGDLTFDASSSDFVIQTLTAVFGATPIALDTDHDSVLTLSNVIPAVYTFTIQTSNGIHGIFGVTIACESDNPTPSPSTPPTVAPTKNPTLHPSALPTPAPTSDPSRDPSSHPTRKPSSAPLVPGNPSQAPTFPTSSPTRQPSDNPTPSPTKQPTPDPTFNPTIAPTKFPSHTPSNNPTPRPSLPSFLTCGEELLGDYNDEAITFNVHLPYNGHLTFDASFSTFAIQSLTAVFGLTPIAFDSDYDGILTISNVFEADYTFSIKAANRVYGTFNVRITCQSDNPTMAPSKHPTTSPTHAPTSAPTPSPTSAPTAQPTKRPTDAPIILGSPTPAPTPPTPLPTRSPTLYPTPRPTDTDSPTHEPTNKPTSIPSNDPSRSPTTPPPTQPDIISCGDEINGPYNNAPVTFNVLLPKTYDGDLVFDASNSFPLTITSLSVVFGRTPIGFDSDQDGMIELQDVTPGIYKFTIIAEPGPYQRYDVQVLCSATHTQGPTGTTAPPTEMPTEVVPVIQTSSTPMITTVAPMITRGDGSDLDEIIAPMLVDPLFLIVCIAAAMCLCICAMTLVFVCLRNTKRRKSRQMTYAQSSAFSENTGFAMRSDVDTQHIVPDIPRTELVMRNDVSVSEQIEAPELRDWLYHTVCLPQYFDVFVKNGFESLKVLKAIRSDEDLRNIGIKKAGHIALLMAEIGRLKQRKAPMVRHDISDNTNVLANCHVAKMRGERGEGEALDHKDLNHTYALETPGKLEFSKCTYCSQVKHGTIYELDGRFYCDECWSYYQ